MIPAVATIGTASDWHDPTDVQVRKIMMARLRSHPALAQHHPILQTREATGSSPSLLQRLEWMLYHSAGSLSEYLHQPSLERRVQGLVTHYKRKRSEREPCDGLNGTMRACAKRQRPRLIVTEDEGDVQSPDARDSVLGSNLDLLHQVCTFLNGLDLVRFRGINKFLYLHAPTFVQSLHIDAGSSRNAATRSSKDALHGLSTFLIECKNITSLRISNSVNEGHVKAGVVFPRALTASKMTCAALASFGYQAVREVAHALKAGACPYLERLELVAPFDFATESDAVFLLLHSLTDSTIKNRKALRHLVLESTFLGDSGIKQLAEVFENHDSYYERLQTLIVRNNFMGESGCRALLESIEWFSELEVLDLSRNILSNTDAFALADLIDDPVTDLSLWDGLNGNSKALTAEKEPFNVFGLAGLRRLELRENFITYDGFHAITVALCARDGFLAALDDAAEMCIEEAEEMEEH
ncbi:uncharacterized protein CCR75_002973 [Bremia lactucae]|uniref:Uncharacterized protein n=1 Tax=Bremia lactucae TaxID=4779 RepID=A0A976NZJ8_BRELC|nr:hypothetical protein CCR75_002973 [Bremia lactucae]